MFGERRKHQRYSIERVARIHSEAGGSQQCTISDISDHGARLFVNDAEIPERFSLQIRGETPMRQECRVVWRLGGEIGVEFVAVGSDQSRLNAIKRIREEARQTFQSANGAS